jgi:putative transposase
MTEASVPPVAANDAVSGQLDSSTDRQRQVAVERIATVQRIEELITSGCLVGEAQARAASERSVGLRSVARWWSATRTIPPHRWADALLPQWHGRQSHCVYTTEALDFFLSVHLRPEKPPFEDSYRRTVDVGLARSWNVPGRKAMLGLLRRSVPTEVMVLRRGGADELEAQYPAQRRDRSCFHALGGVNADGHRFDVQAIWPDGYEGRPMMVVWQDLASGKILSWRVDKTENASSIRLSFGDMVRGYGIPGQAYLDNGRGFASKWMTGRMLHRYRFKIRAEEPAGILTMLGVQVHWATPYHGQAKPIERAFRDLCDTISKHPKFSGAYTGNSTVTKPSNYGRRKVQLADFLQVAELEIKDHNARAGRRTRACQGELSFDEAFTRSYAGTPIRKATDEQLRLLLLAAEGLSIRKGGIHLMGNEFWSPEIASHMGESVVVRFDPDRVQDAVHVYDLKGNYIGFAECNAPVGFSDADAAREHSRNRRQWTKAIKKASAAIGTIELDEAAQMAIAALESKHGASAPPQSKVVRPLFGKGSSAATLMSPCRDDLERDEQQGSLLAKLGARARENLAAEGMLLVDEA